MIRTTNWEGHTLLIDPFSIDIVVYHNHTEKGAYVRLFAQGVPVHMDAKVFEADVLPTIEEETKYGTLND